MDLVAENDVERLRRIAGFLKGENERLLKILAQKCSELDQVKGGDGELQRTLALLESESRKAEAASPPQSAPGAPRTQPSRKPSTGHGPTPQPELERVTLHLELDEPDRTCPECGERLEPMKGQVETSEMVDVVEVSYRVVQVERQKYACRCGACVETAPAPERAAPGGRYSLDFAAHVATQKYLDHMPLERQSRAMARHGLEVTSQTLWDQLYALAVLLMPVYAAIKARILAKPVMGLDQTGWPNLEHRGAKLWQMWVLSAPDAVYHTIRDDKSAETFVDVIGDFRGTIVCDALATHGAGARGSPGVSLAGCWAHIRRKFAEAEPDFPQARVMLDLIRELYDIDAAAEGDAERAELRRTKSRDVLARMKAWMGTLPAISSTSLGAAIKHTANHWDRLTRFADDPNIWLDNNPSERALRGPVVGRRNHFGSKSHRGTEVAALFYTLVETAKLAGVDPAAYLAEAARTARLGGVLVPSDCARTE